MNKLEFLCAFKVIGWASSPGTDMSVLKKVLKAGRERVNFTRSMLVLGQLVVQRLQTDTQKPRGTSLVPFNLPKSLEDQTLLRFRERRAERKRKGGMARACSLDFCRQMRRTYNRSLAEQDSLFDRVFQLSDISRPPVGTQDFHGCFINSFDGLPVARGILFEKRAHQKRDVLAAFSQGGYMHP